jgi:hypothetical protein
LNTQEEEARYLAFFSTRGSSDLGVRLRKLDFVFLWKQVCSSRERLLDAVEEPSNFELWTRETKGEKTKYKTVEKVGGLATLKEETWPGRNSQSCREPLH